MYPHLKHLLYSLLLDTDTSYILVDYLHYAVMKTRSHCWCHPPRMIYPIFKGRLYSVDLAVKAYRLIRLHRLSRLLWVLYTPPTCGESWCNRILVPYITSKACSSISTENITYPYRMNRLHILFPKSLGHHRILHIY